MGSSGPDTSYLDDGRHIGKPWILTIIGVVSGTLAVLCLILIIICFKRLRSSLCCKHVRSRNRRMAHDATPRSSAYHKSLQFQLNPRPSPTKRSSHLSDCSSVSIEHELMTKLIESPPDFQNTISMIRRNSDEPQKWEASRDIERRLRSYSPDEFIKGAAQVFHEEWSASYTKSSRSPSTSSNEPPSTASLTSMPPSTASLTSMNMRCSSSDDDSPFDLPFDHPTANGNLQKITPLNCGQTSNDARINLLRRRFQDITSNKSKAVQLEMMFTTADFAIGYFDHNGGYLEIPDASVNLYIPPGALNEGCHQEVYIYIHHCRDYADGYPLKASPISPTIRCGPPGLQFQKDIFGVVLSFPSTHNDREFNVFTKNSDDNDWINLSNQAKERCFTGGDGIVSLIVSHFSDYKTEELQSAEKKFASETGLRLGAFGRPLQPKQRIFQCYICTWDSPSEKKNVDEAADRLGYYPLQDSNRPIDVNQNDIIKVRLANLKNGWKLRYPDQHAQIIDVSKHQSYKCDFDMEYTKETGYTGGLDCRFIGSIDALPDAQAVQIPIHVNEGWKCQTSFLPDYEDETFDGTSAEALGNLTFGSVDPKVSRHLSKSSYYDLCLALNEKTQPPTDWRMLMAELGLDEMKYIYQVEDGKEAGSVVVINLFFSKNKGEIALQKLYAACKKVHLHRAVEILENDQPQLRSSNTTKSHDSRCQEFVSSNQGCNSNVTMVTGYRRGVLASTGSNETVGSFPSDETHSTSYVMNHMSDSNISDSNISDSNISDSNISDSNISDSNQMQRSRDVNTQQYSFVPIAERRSMHAKEIYV